MILQVCTLTTAMWLVHADGYHRLWFSKSLVTLLMVYSIQRAQRELPSKAAFSTGNNALRHALPCCVYAPQVLQKDDSGPWYSAPQNALGIHVIRECLRKNTYLQVKVQSLERFSSFACGMAINPNEGRILGNQDDKNSVIIWNSCDVRILLVVQPTSAQESVRQGNKVGLNAAVVGGTFQTNVERSSHVFPAASNASFVSMPPTSSHTTDVLGRKSSIRLLFATKEKTYDCGIETSTLKLWGSLSTQGGREVRLIQPLINDAPQNQVNIERGTDLKTAILELDSGR